MKKQLLLIAATLCMFVAIDSLAFAQSGQPRRKDVIEAGGEPELFQSQLRYLMLVGSGFVILDPACDFAPGDLGPYDVCIVLNPGTDITTFDVRDIGHITLPRNSTKNATVFMTNHFTNFELRNSTGSPQPSAVFSSQPYITVESEALSDPRAVDADGNPLNGKLDNLGIGAGFTINKSLAVDERMQENLNGPARVQSYFSKTALTASFAEGGFGLPSDIVDRMFRGAITIRVNVRGRARLVSGATVVVGFRIFGN